MNIDLKQLAAKIENWLRQPIHSLMLLTVWTMWIMCATMAWSNLFRQIKFGPVFPFVATVDTGLNLIWAFVPAALLYFIPRRIS